MEQLCSTPHHQTLNSYYNIRKCICKMRFFSLSVIKLCCFPNLLTVLN